MELHVEQPRGVVGALEEAADAQEVERLEKLARSTDQAGASELLLLAQEFVIEGRFQDALPLLVDASRLEPQNFMLWYALGICYDGVGQNEAATSCYTTCIALAPHMHTSPLCRATRAACEDTPPFAVRWPSSAFLPRSSSGFF